MSEYPPSSDPWQGEGGPSDRPLGPPLASWGQRLAAWLIDLFIGLAFPLVGAVLSGGEGPLLLLGYLGQLAFVIWNHVRQGQTGQTVGKGVLNIRLARLDGQVPPGVGLSIGRYFLHILDALPCYLGFLWPLWDEKRQTFADKILNTVVVAA